MEELAHRFRPFSDILTGFILPKFFIENCGAYIEVIQGAGADYYYMPIFESASMIDLRHRYDRLAEVRDRMEAVSGRILNVRVGGNDFSHAFGRSGLGVLCWKRLGVRPAAGDGAGPAVRLCG